MKPILSFTFFLLFFSGYASGQNAYDTLKTVKMMAVADHEAIRLSIEWKDDPGINTYELFKKEPQDTSWGEPITTVNNQDGQYLDEDIEEGQLYEYRVVKTTGDTIGYGYLFSGVNYIAPQKKGDILLLIDSLAADFVQDNLATYERILISEGWHPFIVKTLENASVQDIKSIIVDKNAQLDSLTTVLLLGNIAVPHSGDINPDGHNNHKGAWPADVYYGDLDGVWTDETVNNTTSFYPRLHNTAGDGKFDQGFIPGKIELVIGRMDFSELPVFDLNEYELLNRYLEKNIAYRTGVYQVKKQAVFKNTNPWVEGLGQNAIRNFVPLVSNDSLVYGDYFDAFYDSFLWSYGGSSGSMVCSNGLGCIDTYADNNFQAIFTANFGSYFGDYDYENNYLRTILGAGKVLSAAWVGAPHWHFYPMGMGMDLGFCTLMTQNNVDLYYAGVFPQSVTINLLGDPTLKAYVVRPPHELTAIQAGDNIELNWLASEETELMGYQVYRKTEAMAYFEPLHSSPITQTHYIDNCVPGGQHLTYLVKAVKQEITPSGSFINYSSGPSVLIKSQPSIIPIADFNLSWDNGVLSTTNLSSQANQYQWLLSDGTVLFDEDFDLSFNENIDLEVVLIATNDCFTDTLQQTIVITNTDIPFTDQFIRLYPNPAQNTFTIETRSPIQEVHLYNVLGERMMTSYDLPTGLHTFDIQQLSRGIYTAKIHIGEAVLSTILLLK